MAHGVKDGIDMPICYPRLVQTGLHQTDFPTLCWIETDRPRMGGVVRHTQHTPGIPRAVFLTCVGYGAWGVRSSRRKPTFQHIFGSGETGRIGCLSIDTHSDSAILSVRVRGYMALVKTGREGKLPVHARQDT